MGLRMRKIARILILLLGNQLHRHEKDRNTPTCVPWDRCMILYHVHDKAPYVRALFAHLLKQDIKT